MRGYGHKTTQLGPAQRVTYSGAIDSDLVVCGLCYLTTPWSCQVGRTIQMMRFFRFTLNSLSKKPAHGTAVTLIANKFF